MLSTLKATLQDRRLLLISAAAALVLAIIGLKVYVFRNHPNNYVYHAPFLLDGRAATINTELSMDSEPATTAHVGDVLTFHIKIDPLGSLDDSETAALGANVTDGSLRPNITFSDCVGTPNNLSSDDPSKVVAVLVPATTPPDEYFKQLDWKWDVKCSNTGNKQIHAKLDTPGGTFDIDYESSTYLDIVEPVEQRVVPILTACSALIAALAGLRGLSLGKKSAENP